MLPHHIRRASPVCINACRSAVSTLYTMILYIVYRTIEVEGSDTAYLGGDRGSEGTLWPLMGDPNLGVLGPEAPSPLGAGPNGT